MDKSKLMRILLMIGCILIVIGVALMAWMLKTAEEEGLLGHQPENGTADAVGFQYSSALADMSNHNAAFADGRCASLLGSW